MASAVFSKDIAVPRHAAITPMPIRLHAPVRYADDQQIQAEQKEERPRTQADGAPRNTPSSALRPDAVIICLRLSRPHLQPDSSSPPEPDPSAPSPLPSAITIFPLLSFIGPLKITSSPFMAESFAASAIFLVSSRDGGTVGRNFDDAILQPAANQVRPFLAVADVVDVIDEDLAPVPFRAGEVALRGEGGAVGVIAAAEDAALLGLFRG